MSDEKFLDLNANPVYIGGDDESRKIKKNLIIVSFVSMFLYFGDVHVSPASSFFGMQFSGLTERAIHLGLLVVMAYLLIHFLWQSFDSLQEWEVRCTSTGKAFRPVLEDNIDEVVKPPMPEDPRNLSLYYWWSTQAGYIGNISKNVEDCLGELKDTSAQTLAYLQSDEGRDEHKVDSLRNKLDKCISELQELNFNTENAAGALLSEQVSESLSRFDRRFCLWVKSQNMKWLLFEFLGPLLAGLCSVYSLVNLLLQ